eukprot:8446195-Pyramimonas_sp.AAC.1
MSAGRRGSRGRFEGVPRKGVQGFACKNKGMSLVHKWRAFVSGPTCGTISITPVANSGVRFVVSD